MRDTSHAGATRGFHPSHPIYATPGLQFIPHRAGLHTRKEHALPRSGELMIWRLAASWDHLSREEAALWLSRDELARMRHHRNPSLARRYAIARVALRRILGDALDKAPETIALSDDAHGQPVLHEPDCATPLSLRIAFAGIWITLGMGADAFGLETMMPDTASAGAELKLASARAACASQLLAQPVDYVETLRTQRIGAMSVSQDDDGNAFKVIDLPMPGNISAAIATPLSTSTLHAYGWLNRTF
ncbi:4'-phosphopantetheinyl transferase family protein [Paraburkholderia bannensis]|uniref:4'-phosphopantetheinyl transferase family protein n=1 Tax=Paraburkholderia bannensis TaxID=765414 RepID=UPI002ABD2785|nr:hypothetical protein [Paraburkholderia bannensis]